MKLATLCYLRRAGQTLLLYRNRKPDDIHAGKWNGLGGKLWPGETPEAGAIREINEESGLSAKRPRLAGLLTFPHFQQEEDWYVFVYTVTEFSGELSDCREGELAWVADDQIAELPLWEGDYYFLPWILAGRLFSARFTYVAKKLQDWEVSFHDMGLVGSAVA